jgi:hypothetical protein
LAIVWTSTTPFTDAGVGERGACACPGDAAHAVTTAMSRREALRQRGSG